MASNTGNLGLRAGQYCQFLLPPLLIKMSRYPSAHGHTPSYKSVGGLTGSSYPSALGSSGVSLTSDLDREMGAMRRELDRGLGSGLGSGLSVSQSVCLI